MARTGAEAATTAVTVACGHCGAGLTFDGVRTATCPYCASPNFVERRAAPDQPDPVFVVAFAGDHAWAKARLDRWLGSRSILADPAIRRARVEDLRGVYLPAYLYSAVARTDYTASIGEHYTETETYTTTDAEGKTKTETRSVTRTEHRPLAGRHVGYVTDVIVSASVGLDSYTLGAIEPYDLRQIRRFSPALVSGWIHEEFSRSTAACKQRSVEEAMDAVGTKLRGFMPGDSYSDLAWRTQIEWESLDPILVPVWVFVVRYRDDKAPLRVVINGQTGSCTGKVPLAWWKVTLACIAAAALIAAIAWIIASLQR